ncbi:MAG: glyoxylate/hydroxypyruvate reductase A [Pseudomonadota bacterium]
MTLVIKCRPDDFVVWKDALQACGLRHEIRHWSDPGPPDDVRYAFVWAPEPGGLARFPKLEVIFSLAIGVEHIFSDPQLPDRPVVRLVAPETTARMAEYVTLSALFIQRGWYRFVRPQKDQLRWSYYSDRLASEVKVGLLGLGEVGRACAGMLKAAGFQVNGWSRTPKNIEGVGTFTGKAELPAFLASTDILACVLPLTAETTNIIDAQLLGALPRGSSIISAGRGQHVDEPALLDALDSGHLESAVLDVFRQEPLAPEHVFWSHPRIFMTPHCAGLATYAERARSLAANIDRYENGEPLLHVADRAAGY